MKLEVGAFQPSSSTAPLRRIPLDCDEDFDLDYHVRHSALPNLAGSTILLHWFRARTGRIMDRERPVGTAPDRGA